MNNKSLRNIIREEINKLLNEIEMLQYRVDVSPESLVKQRERSEQIWGKMTDEKWEKEVERMKKMATDQEKEEEIILSFPYTREFYDKMGIKPGEEQDYFWSRKGNIKLEDNPFTKGTWAYYNWMINYLRYGSKITDYQTCKQNATQRKKAASYANRKYKEIELYGGDDDC